MLVSFSPGSVLARDYGVPRLVRGLETTVCGTLALLGGGVSSLKTQLGYLVEEHIQFSQNCEDMLQGHSLEGNYRNLIETLSESEGPCEELDLTPYCSLEQLLDEEKAAGKDKGYVSIIVEVLKDCRQDYHLSELYWRLSEEGDDSPIIQVSIGKEGPIECTPWHPRRIFHAISQHLPI